MAGNLQQRIGRLQSKASLLADRYRAVKRAKDEAEATAVQLKAEIERLKRTIAVKENAFLRMPRSNA